MKSFINLINRGLVVLGFFLVLSGMAMAQHSTVLGPTTINGTLTANLGGTLGGTYAGSPILSGLWTFNEAPTGTGITSLFSSPPCLGCVAPAAGNFTSLTANLSGGPLPLAQSGTVSQIANTTGVPSRYETDSFAAPGFFSAVRADGTSVVPTAILSGEQIGGFNAFGFNGTSNVGPTASFRTFATENWTTGKQGTYADIATTPTGTATLSQVLIFENDGGMASPGVTGGDEGSGTINLQGVYSSGINIGTLAIGSLQASNNLSDLNNSSAARTNLGLGTIATQNANAVDITGATVITGLPAPINATDAATKAYVDSASSGLTVHTAVAAATVTILPDSPTYSNGSSGVGATLTATSAAALTIDGYSVNLNDRILVKNQAAPLQNGCYTVSTLGSGSAEYVLTRCTDFNQTSNITSGSYFFVNGGSTNGGSGWIQTTTGSITVGTTSIVFTQFNSSATYSAGTGLAQNGTVFSVAAGGITNTQLASGAAASNLGYTAANVANNLSDLTSASTARSNLALGTAATANTGTSGAVIPFLNGANTISNLWTYNDGLTVSSGNLAVTGGTMTLGGGSLTAAATTTTTVNIHTQYGIGGSFYSNGTAATADYLQFYAQPTGGTGLGIYSKGSTDTEIPIDIIPSSISGTSLVNVSNGIITNAATVQGNKTNSWNQNESRVASDKFFADSANGFVLDNLEETFGGNQITGTASSGASNGVISFSALSPVPAAPAAAFTATISTGGTLNVTAVTGGTLAVGQNIIPTGNRFSVNGMTITALGSGTGGVGTYTVSPAPTTNIASELMIGQIPGGIVYVAADTTTPSNLTANSFLLASSAGSATVSANASSIVTGDTIVFYPTVGARTAFTCTLTQAGPTGDYATTYGQPFYSCGAIGAIYNSNFGGTSLTNLYGIPSVFNTNLIANDVTYASAFVQTEMDQNVSASSSGGIMGWLKFVFGTNGLAQSHGFLNQDFNILWGSAISGSYVDKALWLGGISNWQFSNTSVWFDADPTIDAFGMTTIASFAGNTMTVTSAPGYIQAGQVISFPGVAVGTTVLAQLTQNIPSCPVANTCPGQAGTYSLSTTPGTIVSETGYVQTKTSGMPLWGALNVNAVTIQPPSTGGFVVQSNGMWVDSLGAYHAGVTSLAPTASGSVWDVTDSIATSFTIANGGSGYQLNDIFRWHNGLWVATGVNGSGTITSIAVWCDPSGNCRYPTYAGLTGQPATITPTLVGHFNEALGPSGLILTPNWTTPGTTLGIGTVSATAINIGNAGSTTNILGAIEAGGTAGVSCNSINLATAKTVNGIFVHC